jgi:hypothetical protein
MRDIQRVRARLRDGEATSDDLTWAQQRLRVLREWPDDLTPEQEREKSWLDTLTSEVA